LHHEIGEIWDLLVAGGLFAAVDTAHRGVTGFFSELLRLVFPLLVGATWTIFELPLAGSGNCCFTELD
jgi:hypothetical protein